MRCVYDWWIWGGEDDLECVWSKALFSINYLMQTCDAEMCVCVCVPPGYSNFIPKQPKKAPIEFASMPEERE